jgi:hypothetical protein
MRRWMGNQRTRIPARFPAALCLSMGLGWALATGCASVKSERNLAPLFSEYSTAGGGVEREALGGIFRIRQSRPGGPWTQWALRPLVIQDREAGGDKLTRFLTPLGSVVDHGDEYIWQLIPVTRYERHRTSDGQIEWTLLTLPGIYWSKRADGRIVRAWFPFGGVAEDFLSWDRLEFVLFPIWARTERAGMVTQHVLWPFFSWTNGPGGPSGRFWPFYGRSAYEGRYDRRFWLWPFFSKYENNLHAAPGGQSSLWMFWPFFGRMTRGTYQESTVLWPFFGYGSDPATGFYTIDAPWPLVERMEAPRDDVSRTRFWPFYSHYHGDGLDSTWYLWPIINVAREEYERSVKNRVYVIPFWQSWKRVDEDAGVFRYTKLWPLFQSEGRELSDRHFAFPALNPLWRSPEFDEMYAWIWELWTRDVNYDLVRERSWLGLWRREKDAAEDRRSFAFLWARRAYRTETESVRETSLLFGLVRWRSGDVSGFELLPPAIPGPGWPLDRVGPSASLDPGGQDQ